MKVKNTRGFGKVTDPRTGDEIDVEEPFETDRETFEALRQRYPGFVAVEPDTTDANPGSEAGETGSGDPTCAGNDGECSRTVDEAGATCWQH